MAEIDTAGIGAAEVVAAAREQLFEEHNQAVEDYSVFLADHLLVETMKMTRTVNSNMMS